MRFIWSIVYIRFIYWFQTLLIVIYRLYLLIQSTSELIGAFPSDLQTLLTDQVAPFILVNVMIDYLHREA